MRAIRIKQVIEKVSLSQSTIYKMMTEGAFLSLSSSHRIESHGLRRTSMRGWQKGRQRADLRIYAARTTACIIGTTVAVSPAQYRAQWSIIFRRRSSISPRW